MLINSFFFLLNYLYNNWKILKWNNFMYIMPRSRIFGYKTVEWIRQELESEIIFVIKVHICNYDFILPILNNFKSKYNRQMSQPVLKH